MTSRTIACGWLLAVVCVGGAALAENPTVKPGPQKSPKTGETSQLPLRPSDGQPPTVTQPALAIVHYQPEGTEQTPPAISVTFNQPMVPITSVGNLSGPAPIRIEPDVPGAWKWQGTTTVQLTPKARLRFGTRYKVTVPGTLRAQSGKTLGHDVVYSFDTPLPAVTQSSPGQNATEVALDALVLVWFNQNVTGDKVAPFVRLTTSDGKLVPFSTVSRAAWANDSRLAGHRNEPNVVALQPSAALAPNTTYRIEVRPGVIADEGPLAGTQRFEATFTTYPPFAVKALRCGDCNSWTEESSPTCTVGQKLCVTFNHAVVEPKPESFVTVTPAPKNGKTLVNYNQIELAGTYAAEQTYKVSVAAGLKDNYKQPLARPWSASIRFEHLPTSVQALVENQALIEKNGALAIPLRVVNAETIEVEAYRLNETQLRAGISAVESTVGSDSWKSAMAPLRSTKVATFTVRPGLPKDKADTYNLSLRTLVQQHGAGTYLLTLGKSDRAVLVQVTDLGLTARYDNDKMVVLVTSIATGRPVAGVTVAAMDDENRLQPATKTGTDGVAVLRAVPHGTERSLGEVIVTANLGSDRSYLRASSYGDDGRSLSFNWGRPYQPPYEKTMFYPDRDLYRPGETVHLYGIVRAYGGGVLDPVSVPKAGKDVTWTATSSRNRELARGTVRPTLFGTFYVSFRLPEQVDLGGVSIQTSLGTTHVRVEEYRAPEFEVAVTPSSLVTHFGDTLSATVSGRYLFGAPMKKATARWTLYQSASHFSPPNHAEFHFGSAPPRWDRYERWGYFERGPQPVASGEAKLDDRGRATVQVSFGAGEVHLDPSALILEAQVTDVSRQVVAGRADLVAHPGDRYVGVRLGGAAIEANRPAPIDVVVVDLDGKRIPNVAIEVKATRADIGIEADVDEDGNARTKAVTTPVVVQPCKAVSADAVQSCSLVFPKSGVYLLEASAEDSRHRRIASQLSIDVLGKDSVTKDTKAGRVELRLDRAEYQPGQTAVITLRAPFSDGVALITEERRGLLAHHVVKIANYVGTAKIVVREEHVPGIEVSATAIRERGKERPRAAWAVGSVRVPIAAASKRLDIELRTAKSIARPGEKVTVDVLVTDAQRRPVKALVSLVAVDEAVLGMTGFATPSPLPFFHSWREPGVALAQLLKTLLPEEGKLGRGGNGDDLKPEERSSRRGDMKEMAASGAAGPGGPSGPAAAVRRLFLTTPGASVLTTDERGHAALVLPLPDNLTRFRVMAVAVDGTDHFGSKESTITTQKPLQLRPSLPRFANTGDAFLAGVIVDNQLPQAGAAEVTLVADGVELTDVANATQRVAIGAGEAKELTWAVKAPRPGVAKFRFVVKLGQETDAVETALPVWIPATAEAFATYGTSTTNVAQPLDVPKNVLPGFGGLAITIGASALNGLQDAARYLIEYPYGCAEQVSSRVMPILVAGEIVEQFHLAGVETLELGRKHAQIAVDKLVSGQRDDGSWGTWMGPNDVPRADLSAYILIVLRRAKEQNLSVPDDTIGRARDYLRGWVAQPPKDTYSRNWRADVQALALFALSEWGEQNGALAKQVYANQADLDLHARGLLAMVFHRLSPQSPERAALLRAVLNRVIQTASSARFEETQSQSLQLLMHSSSRTDAILLLTLLELAPSNELVPKIVRGLLDARQHGRWETTQSNSYAMWALARYFKVYESAPTAFVAELFVGRSKVGESKFAERSLREDNLDVPMQLLQEKQPKDVTIGKTGSGRFYYRIGMKYAPRDLALRALDQGMTVSRTYESASGSKDEVRQNSDGSWEIAAGAYVRVKLSVVVQDRRFYVVVDDALPAGLELVNSIFKTAAKTPTAHDPEAGGAWWGEYPSWRFNHRELRDERSLHFADDLEPGTYHLNVLARATVRGTFIVPPTRAEEMYHPEVFGRAATDRVTVK